MVAKLSENELLALGMSEKDSFRFAYELDEEQAKKIMEFNARIRKLEARVKELELLWVADAVAGALAETCEYHKSMLTRRCA
jgi:hypothetical protein